MKRKRILFSCIAVALLLSAAGTLSIAGVVNSRIQTSAEAALSSIAPDEITASPAPQTKLFTLRGSGFGFGRAQVVFAGPQETAIRPVFAFALLTRVLVIAIISSNPEPGQYEVSLTRGDSEASGVSISIIGGETDNDTTTTTTVPGDGALCVPCGDFAPTCDVSCAATINSGRRCPVCMTVDNSTAIIKFDDGSYYTMGPDPEESGKVITTYYDKYDKVCFSQESTSGQTTLYDNQGVECYTVKPGSAEDTADFIYDGKTYTMLDNETWACPDGSTWKLDPSCTDEITVDTGTEGCSSAQLPPCEG